MVRFIPGQVEILAIRSVVEGDGYSIHEAEQRHQNGSRGVGYVKLNKGLAEEKSSGKNQKLCSNIMYMHPIFVTHNPKSSMRR